MLTVQLILDAKKAGLLAMGLVVHRVVARRLVQAHRRVVLAAHRAVLAVVGGLQSVVGLTRPPHVVSINRRGRCFVRE